MQMVREAVCTNDELKGWKKDKGKSHDISSGPKETNKTPQILISSIILQCEPLGIYGGVPFYRWRSGDTEQ